MKRLMMLAVAIAAAMPLMAETEDVGGYTWTYRINGDTAEIYNNGSAVISPSPTGAVTIPSTLGGKTVTSIGERAFSGCSELTSVTIPDGVTSIGDRAFYRCGGLTVMTIGSSITNIGAYAFYGCNSLTSITIPDSVTCIGESALASCNRLTSVTIGNGLLSIAERMFEGCNGLTNVLIPNSVTNIGYYAFKDCAGLTGMTIPNSVSNIHTYAFYGCVGLMNSVYCKVFSSGGTNGTPSGVVTTVVHNAESPYVLTNAIADRAIASVTVDGDSALDAFVLKEGKVYDTVLYVVNASASAVHLTLPAGYVYVTPKGKTPLTIPGDSMNLVTITRVAERTFLVTRQQLEIVK